MPAMRRARSPRDESASPQSFYGSARIMIGEIDILGVFVPAVLVLMFIAYLVNLAIRTVLARVGFYRLVWHRSIFDLGIYVLVLGLVVIVSHRFVT
jgi:hypothetical protein